jgi:hypothetical protein
MKYSLLVPGKAIDSVPEDLTVNAKLDLISSRPSEMGTRTKLDEVVEAGLNIFGGKKF